MSRLAEYLFGYSGPMHTDWKYYGTTWHAVASDASDYSYLDSLLSPYGVNLSIPHLDYGPANVRQAMRIQPNIARSIHPEEMDLQVGGYRYWLRVDEQILVLSDVQALFPMSDVLLGWSTVDGVICNPESATFKPYRDAACDLGGIAGLLLESELASLEISDAFYRQVFCKGSSCLSTTA